MSNKTLQELILKNVVIHYIETPEPIGSSQLKESLDLNVSPATIRNYFKKLVAEGYLDQLHSSSGRIPTSMAFKEYWYNQLSKEPIVHIESENTLSEGSKFFGLFTVVRVENENRLLNIYSVEDKFLVLDFEEGELIFKHEKILETFLAQFIGYDILDILKVSMENRVETLTVKLNELIRKKIFVFNERELVSISKENGVWSENHFREFYEGNVVNRLENGIYFEHFSPDGHMIVRKSGFIDSVPISITVLGHMSRDFNRFFSSI